MSIGRVILYGAVLLILSFALVGAGRTAFYLKRDGIVRLPGSLYLMAQYSAPAPRPTPIPTTTPTPIPTPTPTALTSKERGELITQCYQAAASVVPSGVLLYDSARSNILDGCLKAVNKLP